MRDVYSAYPVRAHAYLMPILTDTWLLTGVEVAHNERGKGHARELMRRVLTDADNENVNLYLSVEPDGTGLEASELMDWYERLGFVRLSENDYGMVRPAKESEKMYISARDIQVNNILSDGTTVTSVTYPVSGDRVEVFTDDGNRIIWFGDSQVEVTYTHRADCPKSNVPLDRPCFYCSGQGR